MKTSVPSPPPVAVGARTAFQQIILKPAQQVIIPRSPGQRIPAIIALQLVIAIAPQHEVRPRPAQQMIAATPAIQAIGTAAAHQRVIACQTQQMVAPARPHHRVITGKQGIGQRLPRRLPQIGHNISSIRREICDLGNGQARQLSVHAHPAKDCHLDHGPTGAPGRVERVAACQNDLQTAPAIGRPPTRIAHHPAQGIVKPAFQIEAAANVLCGDEAGHCVLLQVRAGPPPP